MLNVKLRKPSSRLFISLGTKELSVPTKYERIISVNNNLQTLK